MSFSERMGYRPVRSALQVGQMDDRLRHGLFNGYYDFLNLNQRPPYSPHRKLVVKALWATHFRRPLDSLPTLNTETAQFIKEICLSNQWNEVYDVIEYVSGLLSHAHYGKTHDATVNRVLSEEGSGYRIIDHLVTPLLLRRR